MLGRTAAQGLEKRSWPGEGAGPWPGGQLVENKAHKRVLGLKLYCGRATNLIEYCRNMRGSGSLERRVSFRMSKAPLG